MQAECGQFYNADSSKLILSEIMQEQGQQAADGPIVKADRGRIFGFWPGTHFAGCMAWMPTAGNSSSQM